MPLPQLIDVDADGERICELCFRWQVAPHLGWKLHELARLLPFSFQIISGYRTPEEQRELEEAGATTAPLHLSTHTSCPATGADIRPAHDLTDDEKRLLGRAGEMIGLRWGGGARRVNGIPIGNEWRHFDLGRRQ